MSGTKIELFCDVRWTNDDSFPFKFCRHVKTEPSNKEMCGLFLEDGRIGFGTLKMKFSG